MSELLLTAIRESTTAEKEFAFAELAKELLRDRAGRSYVIRDESERLVGYVIDGQEASGEPAFPRPGTPEWGAMNALRQTLIRKKVRGELTDDEQPLYERLQRQSLEVVEAEFPFRPV